MLNSHSNINVVDVNESQRPSANQDKEGEVVVTEYGDLAPDRSKAHLKVFLKNKDRELAITQQENRPEELTIDLPTNIIDQEEERRSNFREIDSETTKPPVLVKSKLRSK